MNEWDWLRGAFVALPTLASALTAWFVITGRGQTPQPLVVQGQARLVTKEELDTVTKRIDEMDGELTAIRESIVESERRMLAEGERRAVAIHKRMDAMAISIEAGPVRTIALIKETKGLIP